jgi:hypothetical protein
MVCYSNFFLTRSSSEAIDGTADSFALLLEIRIDIDVARACPVSSRDLEQNSQLRGRESAPTKYLAQSSCR